MSVAARGPGGDAILISRVVLASSNPGKLRELQALLAPKGWQVESQSQFGLVTPPEDGNSFVENALIKARYALAATGLPCIADDSGLVVDALGGRPGIHSARFAGEGCSDEDNIQRLLEELSGVPEDLRGARYHCALVMVWPGTTEPLVCEASWEGRIALRPRGDGGFGYDPLFIVTGDTRTAAEMPSAEKNRISHRARAFDALAAGMPTATISG